MARDKREAKFATQTITPLSESAEAYFRLAKLGASKALGYSAPAIRALNPRFSDDEFIMPGVKYTMAVDKYYRIYVGNKFVLEQVELARAVSDTNPCKTCGATSHHELAYVAGTIGHEAWHLVRKHSGRFTAMGVTDHRKWNRAADLELNDDLNQIYLELTKPDLCLPTLGLWPSKLLNTPTYAKAWETNPLKVQFDALLSAYHAQPSKETAQPVMDLTKSFTDEDNEQLYSHGQVEKYGVDVWPLFTDGKMAEQYYAILPTDPPCPVHDKDEAGDGKGLKGPNGPAGQTGDDGDDGDDDGHSHGGLEPCTCPHTTEHGSGVDGKPRDYELGPPDGDNPGVSEAEGKIISREVAARIKKSNARGTLPAGMARWADEELEGAKYDWRTELSKAIMYGAGRKDGASLHSFQRLGILTGANQGRILFPMKYDPVPDVTVVQDTSGSMCQYALNASASEIDGICKALGAAIRFTSVDARASELVEVTDVRNLVLTGGGGTDMRVGIEAAVSDPSRMPSVVIVMTDGHTPWPDIPPNGGRTTLIVCLVGESTAELETVPSWALGIKIEGENPEVKEAA